MVHIKLKTYVIKMEDLIAERKSLDFDPSELAELHSYFGGVNEYKTLKVLLLYIYFKHSMHKISINI